MDCDLYVYTNQPVQLEITSLGGTLVSWNGSAGLTRVPEPDHSLEFAMTAAVLALVKRDGSKGNS